MQLDRKKIFNYSDYSWYCLREEYRTSNNSLLDFCSEVSGKSYPRKSELLKRAKKEGWGYAREHTKIILADTPEEREAITSSAIQKELERYTDIVDKLQFVYTTVQTCRNFQNVIASTIPRLQRSLTAAKWETVRSPGELARILQALTQSYKTLNDIQAKIMLPEGSEAFIEGLGSTIDSSMSLSEVEKEIQDLEDSDLASLLKEFI